MNRTNDGGRALALAAVLVVSVVGGAVTFAGVAGATATTATTTTSGPYAPGDTIDFDVEVGSTTNDVLVWVDDGDGTYQTDETTTTVSVSSTGTESDSITLPGDQEVGSGFQLAFAQTGGGFSEGLSADTTTGTFPIDGATPTVDIDTPTDGANLSAQPTIAGTASDDVAVDRVELTIQRENGDYYTGSEWQGSEKTVKASGTTDWSYDTYDNGIEGDDNYTVEAAVFDTAGKEDATLPPSPDGEADTRTIEYTVDNQPVSVSTVEVTHQGADDTVSVGDTVEVSATVTDATSPVANVTVDAAVLGGPADLALTETGSDSYEATFEVASPSVGDGSVSLTVSAEDTFGLSDSGSDSVTLDTAVAEVGTLSIEHEFVGIVEDPDSSVTVEASGIVDARGNTIGSGSVDVTIGDETVLSDVSVSDGSLSATFDPTTISNTADTGEASVALTADAGSVTNPDVTVELVHETVDLDAGYQVLGTPMDAEDVVFENVSNVVTYDPATDSWVAPDENEAGEGYYADADTDAARAGYVFEPEDGPESDITILQQGFNLISASPDLNSKTEVTASDDLTDQGSIDTNNVQVYVRNDARDLVEPSGSTDAAAYDRFADPSAPTVSAFGAYFVYVDSGTEERDVVDRGYDPGDGS